MARMVVLGGGMVGSAMAMDLARHGHDVTLADRSQAALDRASERWGVATRRGDLSDPAVISGLARDADVVLGALPSVLGEAALRTLVELRQDYVDISFMEQDPRHLDALARERGATVVYDCGVAPGMSNLLAGRAVAALQPCERLHILVGGLPVLRHQPFEYKAPFAPWDVLEEYTRPARIVQGGQVVVRDALSEVEPVDIEGVGTLEAFNTDGLRSLADLDVPDMIEKTMRYPGHAALMRAFREAGLFSLEPIELRGQRVVPREVTAAMLFPRWTFDDREADLTAMRVVAEGQREGRPVRWRWDLLDRYDAATDLRSMSRTTAFPATIVAGLVAEGRFRRPGVHAPEVLGADAALTDAVLTALADRGVRYTFREEAR